MPLRDQLLELLHKYPGELFKLNEISKMMAIKSDSERYQDLRDLLRQLEEEGAIVHGSRRRYGLPKVLRREIEGELRVLPTGNGIVTPAKEFDMEGTVLIRPEHLSTAMDGDKVRVTLFAPKQTGDRSAKQKGDRGSRQKSERTDERPEGEVTEVKKQKAHQTVGVVERTRNGFAIRPESGRMKQNIIVTKKDLHGAKEGDRVRIELYDWLDESRQPEGFVLATLTGLDEKGFSNDSIIAELGLPGEFPSQVLKEAHRFPDDPTEAEIAKRLDLRDRIIFTIDPEDAKDFDDAVSLEQNPDGTLTLGVHIADVSHYVTEGSALDDEALARGTSIYLVGGVIPMLPERLSNELCSLRPDEDKLAYSVFMKIDPNSAEVLSSTFHKSVIRSVMRFSYEEAESQTLSGNGKYAKELQQMRKLSEKMYDRRHEAGSIDFESTEFRFRFNEKGEPTEAYQKPRLGSMRMIEDFMLAANRAVAEFIAKKAKQGAERPFIYRIHADPDPVKLGELSTLAKTLGYKLNIEHPTPKVIQQFLDSVRGKPEEHLLNQLMLRAMAKAVYAEHNVGHFGLAFLHYTHFTSPIRRYPDLIVHRMLFEYERPGGMNREREHHYFEILPGVADQTSALERRATEAERESNKLAQIHLLKDKVGELFDAVISGVMHFGLFVQLPSGAEGLLHIRELPGHYVHDEAHYALVKTSGRFNESGAERYRIGDPIKVQLVKVLEDRRQLDFRLAESAVRDEDAVHADSMHQNGSLILKGIRRRAEISHRDRSEVARPERRGSRAKSGSAGTAKPSWKKGAAASSTSGRPAKRKKPSPAGAPPRKGRPPKRRSR